MDAAAAIPRLDSAAPLRKGDITETYTIRFFRPRLRKTRLKFLRATGAGITGHIHAKVDTPKNRRRSSSLRFLFLLRVLQQ
jgi:hypothetical protein